MVNGEEVEYLHIHEDLNGDIIVDYDEKFNLVKAHVGEIPYLIINILIELKI